MRRRARVPRARGGSARDGIVRVHRARNSHLRRACDDPRWSARRDRRHCRPGRRPVTAPLLVRACRRERVERTPVWFMRQAGRCLADYRELRERFGILDIARNPELSARVTAMPVDQLGVDAAVLYADIMLPLDGMGVPFRIEPEIGPIIERPVRTARDVDALRVVAAEEATPYLFESIRALRASLPPDVALIGFAGAPFTIASYLVEGRPSRDHARAKGMLAGEPALWDRLLGTLAEVISRYLVAQVKAGVDVIQLFDSWAGVLSPVDYERAVLPHSRRIFDAVASTGVPRIHFFTGNPELLRLAARNCEAVSVDWRIGLAEAWRRIGDARAIQGNLDPAICLAPFPVVAERTRAVLREAGRRRGHIFNLGHGVLPETDADTLRRITALVREETAA
ncbi:MAG: uroporphyrinogen decarboxylase [Chloroflexi bacterium]|nr:MAG: uroporphyrinogen decarboxylase [Chloroflexota bacterium]